MSPGRAVLSIGSNVGDRLVHLRSVIDAHRPALLAASSAYETAPWGGVEQADFLNAVLVVARPGWDGWAWLRAARVLEEAADRRRTTRWGPRSLDVDVIDCDGAQLADDQLSLPHPRAHERAFVLVPWLQIDPAAVLPGQGRAADCLARLPSADVLGVRRRDELSLLP